jgi:hypothetical protein
VLRVVTRLNVGGPARQALFLTDELRNRGFETRLVWGAAGPDEGTFEPSDDLPRLFRVPPAPDGSGRRPPRRRRDRRRDPAVAPADRPHASREGGRPRARGRAGAARSRHRPHVPRPRAPGVLRTPHQSRLRHRGASARAENRRAARRLLAGPRRPPGDGHRNAVAVARRSRGRRSRTATPQPTVATRRPPSTRTPVDGPIVGLRRTPRSDQGSTTRCSRPRLVSGESVPT